MCGICGIITRTENVCPETISRMISVLRHRGPDESGMYVSNGVGLGNARLKIIDLVGGRQPIFNEDKRLCIVFNGMIYNYPELRARLESRHRFSTHTDTETILHLYEEYGYDCVNYLDGMFAFAIYDFTEQGLFLARDRVGKKPFYYYHDSTRFIFGSEQKAILASGFVNPQLRPASVYNFMYYNHLFSPYTMFEGIYELPPAHYGILKDGQLQLKRYWNLQFPTQNDTSRRRSLSWYMERFDELLHATVKKRLTSDVEVGTYLSGGIDSWLTTTLVRHHAQKRFKTFSLQVDASLLNEEARFRRIRDYLDVDSIIVPCCNNVVSEYIKILWHLEFPQRWTSPIALYYLAQASRANGIKCILTGEGADELFGGYDCFKTDKLRRYMRYAPRQIKRCLYQKAYQYLPCGKELAEYYVQQHARSYNDVIKKYGIYPPWYDVWGLTGDMIHEVFQHGYLDNQGNENGEYFSLIRDPVSRNTDTLDQALYFEFYTRLSQWILSMGDRMSMAHGVELRCPYLDHHLIEFVATIPTKYKMRFFTEKWFLRKYAERYIPRFMAWQPKQPLLTPIGKWFFDKKTISFVYDYLSKEKIQQIGVFNADTVNQLLGVYHSHPHFSLRKMQAEFVLFSVFNMQFFADIFVKCKEIISEPEMNTPVYVER